MKRVEDFNTNTDFNGDASAPMINTIHGGQQGYSSVLGKISNGELVNNFISNQAYVSKDVIPILIQAPEFFQYMPDPKGLEKTLKSIMETHSITIDGLNSTLTVEMEGHAIGGSGEQQEEVTDVTRAVSEPTHEFVEKINKPINKFWENFIRYGIMDENSKVPQVTLLEGFDGKDRPYDAGMYSFVMLYIEPDTTYTKVVNAWLCGNMIPKTGGENTGKKDKSSPGELSRLSIPFSAITVPSSNKEVYALADKLLNEIASTRITFNSVPTFVKEKDAGVNEEAAPTGFLSSSESK